MSQLSDFISTLKNTYLFPEGLAVTPVVHVLPEQLLTSACFQFFSDSQDAVNAVLCKYL